MFKDNGILRNAAFLTTTLTSFSLAGLSFGEEELAPAPLPGHDFLGILQPVEVGEFPKPITREERLTSSKGFQSLSETQQQKVLDLFHDLAGNEQITFQLAVNREMEGGTPILLNKDSKGHTLLDNLAVLSSTRMPDMLEAYRSDLIESFLLEIGEPGQLNQAGWGVCGVSSIYELFRDQPAEAARLFTGLVSESGKVDWKPGVSLQRAKYSMAPDPEPGRSHSERLFLSALMELANGSEFCYCNFCDQNYHVRTGETYSGTEEAGVRQLEKLIWGESVTSMSSSNNQQSSLMYQLKTLGEGLHPVILNWRESSGGSGGVEHTRHVLPSEELKGDRFEGHHFFVGPEKAVGGGKVQRTHLILAIKVSEGRVHYRNLHRETTYENGHELLDPPRRIESWQEGIESMTIEEFQKRMRVIFYRSK